MNLHASIQTLQRAVGVIPDGVCGPVTVRALLAHLSCGDLVSPMAVPVEPLDERTLATIATLDRKAQQLFRVFMCLAKATAATYGCDYILISGNRTWDEQDALYAQGRSKPGAKVTNAPGGYSYHNFGIAADAGVFSGKIYLDDGSPSQQARAHQVHQACSLHAISCGLSSGASWSSFPDEPHYQVDTGHATPTDEDRQKFRLKGSIL